MDIARFIAKGNPTQALTSVDEPERKCEALGDSPDIGTARPELVEAIRMLAQAHYIIFYRKRENGLRI